MHNQIFISGVWWSGAYYLADIASINGYDLGRRLNSRNDNVFAWKTGPFYSMDGNASPGSLQDTLETKWPFDEVSQEDSDSFRDRIVQARSPHGPDHNCCKLSTFCMMTPLINSAFPDAPIINVIRNPIDISTYESDNYFLRLLMQDRAQRKTHTDDIDFVEAMGYLFDSIGDLRWKVKPTSETGWHIDTRVKPILWNLLYTLRWVMIQDRLNLDIQTHNIENHHTIKFEDIVQNDKEELEKLQDILAIPGKLKIPAPPREDPLKMYREAYSYKTTLLPALENKKLMGGTTNLLKAIYQISKPYLERFEYTETIEIIENSKAIK